MKTLKLLLGPVKIQEMLATAARQKKNVHRVLVYIDLDERKDVLTGVHYYLMDDGMSPITDENDVALRGNGCPYPPECDGNDLLELAKTRSADSLARCVLHIEENSDR
jgi:hypothetical protein